MNKKLNKISFDKIPPIFQSVLLILFAVIFLLKAYSTLDWRMEHDTPLLHYAAFLMDKYHLFPYRDIFETSMPGTFFFHYIIGKLFGYSDAAFRYVDLLLLGTLLTATYIFMKRFGGLVASWAVILFGLVYFSFGQTMSLQRDYIGIIPIALAMLAIPSKIDSPVRRTRFAYIGLLFGLSVLIKPHLGIALPILFVTLLSFRWHSHKKSKLDFFVCSVTSGVSFLIPVIIALVWLGINSALTPFIDIIFNYLPLHNLMTGDYEALSEHDHILYLIEKTFMFGSIGAIFLCSLIAYYHAATNADEDKVISISLTFLLLCTLSYAFYPTVAGKFWEYHYMPFAYFCSISAGLCIFNDKQTVSSLLGRFRRLLPTLILFVAMTIQLPLFNYLSYLVYDLRSGPQAHAPKYGRVDEIANWLKSRLRPGDTVQPLDWTGGSIHGMLLAGAKLPTQFMYDYHFYHNVSTPYIQGLRKLFISQLRNKSPRFIIKVDNTYFLRKPWVSGIDTTREFPELHKFIDDNYLIVFKGKGYQIYELFNGMSNR